MLETVYLSEQAVVTMLFSAVEAYENKDIVFHGEYFPDTDQDDKTRFSEPKTIYEAIRYIDKHRDKRANLFVERGYRQVRQVPAESIGYILGNREETRARAFAQLAIPYQIAQREFDRVKSLTVLNPRKFRETLTPYTLIGSFHSHPWIFPKERRTLRPEDSSPSRDDREGLVQGQIEVIIAIVKNNSAKKWKYVGKDDYGYWGSLSTINSESYEIMLRAWKKPGRKGDEVRIQCPYLMGVGEF
jgi:proteasome lid subunit RPN8/RPN11